MRIAWIAGNYGEVLRSLGRIADARRMYLESVDAASVLGDEQVIAARELGLAMTSFLLGDRDGAEALVTPDLRRLTRGEPQTRAYLAALEAWLAWPDADRAIDRLLEEARVPGIPPHGDVAGLLLARIALRARRPDALAAGVALTERAVEAASGRRMQLTRDVARALGDGSADAVERLAAAAVEMADAGYVLPAAEVFADAAILASRLGLGGRPYAQRARELFAASSAVPPLGDPVDAIAGVPARS